ncbi:hypothetical protein ACIRSS_34645 [Amycolatopsis sp. NPDC101161]|uniref:hypothetical protein n=1 Tax=Amycolatopsis sp. NPDC101161 TaxID=3363940 RepID=UPI00380B3655
MPEPDSTRPPAARLGGRAWGWDPPGPGGGSGIIGVAPFPETGPGEAGRRGGVGLNTAHCTIVVVDVEGFGLRSRTNPNKVRVRRGMYRALERAFVAAAIPWAACRHADLGDGVLVLAPARISKVLFADLLLGPLADELAAHNGAHPPSERIRLRLALHAGEVSYDDYGVTGSSILHAQQLLDASELKRSLAGTTALLAVIASDWLFDEVIRHSERSCADAYHPVGIANGGVAWIRLVQRRRDLSRRLRFA